MKHRERKREKERETKCRNTFATQYNELNSPDELSKKHVLITVQAIHDQVHKPVDLRLVLEGLASRRGVGACSVRSGKVSVPLVEAEIIYFNKRKGKEERNEGKLVRRRRRRRRRRQVYMRAVLLLTQGLYLPVTVADTDGGPQAAKTKDIAIAQCSYCSFLCIRSCLGSLQA